MNYISIQEIIDYAKCPMYYALKYRYPELKTEYINLIEKYDADIHKVIYYSFSKVQEGLPIRIEDIKVAWGRAWIKDKRKTSIIFSDTLSNKDVYNDRRRRGLNSLISFQKEFSRNPGFPVIINKQYELKINNFLTLTGYYEVVREVEDEMNNKYLEVCNFKTDEHTNTKVNKMYDMKLIASSLAISNDVVYDNIKYMNYHVDKKKFYYLNDIHTHEKIFKQSILNIYKLIYNNIFYICPDERCMNCIYKDLCGDIDIIGNVVIK